MYLYHEGYKLSTTQSAFHQHLSSQLLEVRLLILLNVTCMVAFETSDYKKLIFHITFTNILQPLSNLVDNIIIKKTVRTYHCAY